MNISFCHVLTGVHLFPREPEVQILSFLTQQYQLLPLIATSYAFRFAGHNMMRMYVVAQAEMEEGNMDSLPELHATSAGLKAFTTEVASQGIEVHGGSERGTVSS